jgi:hypothetical protein
MVVVATVTHPPAISSSRSWRLGGVGDNLMADLIE